MEDKRNDSKTLLTNYAPVGFKPIRPNLSIEERIYEMYNQFLAVHLAKPNAIFIRHEDYYEMMKNRRFYETSYTEEMKERFMGLQLIRVSSDKTYVALVTEVPDSY